jgi:hypothetical protein
MVRDTLIMNTHALVRTAPFSVNPDYWCESRRLGQAGRPHFTLHVDKQLVGSQMSNYLCSHISLAPVTRAYTHVVPQRRHVRRPHTSRDILITPDLLSRVADRNNHQLIKLPKRATLHVFITASQVQRGFVVVASTKPAHTSSLPA